MAKSGRPKTKDKPEPRWAVYMAAKYKAAFAKLAGKTRRTMRAELELAAEDWLRKHGEDVPNGD
jgi:hypothetical protein